MRWKGGRPGGKRPYRRRDDAVIAPLCIVVEHRSICTGVAEVVVGEDLEVECAVWCLVWSRAILGNVFYRVVVFRMPYHSPSPDDA